MWDALTPPAVDSDRVRLERLARCCTIGDPFGLCGEYSRRPAATRPTASSAHSELASYLVPVRNGMTTLSAKADLSPARDFALGVLIERVRQEEGWPDHPGDHSGVRTGHGTGVSRLCLLERKHEVEDAIYAIA